MNTNLGPGPLLLAVGLLLIIAGCGGSSGERTDDPREVARMYVAASFDCENGAGRQYDLSTSPNRDWDRATYIQFERRRGCRPRPLPDLDVALLAKESDVARVQVADEAGHVRAQLVVVRLDGTWKGDTLRSVTS